MGKLRKLFGTTGSAYDEATEHNNAGAPAFYRGDEEQLLRVLMTGTLSDTYYVSVEQLADEAIALFKKLAAADPQYTAQAILYALEKGNMRTAPITALAVLSKSENADAKEMARRIFARVIQTPGDLQDFFALCRHSTIRGNGRLIRRLVNQWLDEMSEYHAIKYGSAGQSASGMSLRDIYRLTHGKRSGKAQQIAHYLVKGKFDPDATVTAPQLFGYDSFKRAASQGASPDVLLEMVQTHRLPWEVVTAHLPANRATWQGMLHQMPYMALLRNLRNLLKYEVLSDKDELKYACAVLSDSINVRGSKQLPFRFWSALKALGNDAPLALRRAIEAAFDHSFVNMPWLGDSVLICNDISGSMDSQPSPQSDMTMAEIAALFASVCFKKAERGKVVSFADVAYPRVLSHEMTLTQMMKVVTKGGGGTNLSAPLAWAFGGYTGRFRSFGNESEVEADPQIFDTAIFLTDNESWVDYLQNHSGIADRIRAYRETRNSGLQVFFIQLQPYRTSQVPLSMEGVTCISGWSADVVNYIGSVLQGGANQIETVKQISLLRREG